MTTVRGVRRDIISDPAAARQNLPPSNDTRRPGVVGVFEALEIHVLCVFRRQLSDTVRVWVCDVMTTSVHNVKTHSVPQKLSGASELASTKLTSVQCTNTLPNSV